MRYSLQERFDILETYLSCNKHQWESVREYRRRFPERNCPSRKTFVSIAEKCRVHKSLMDRKRKKRHPKLTPDQQLDVLLYFQEFPKSSLRKAELALRIPRSSINKVLKDNKLKPFKVLPTQKLLPQDYEKRIRFCESMLQMNEEDHPFFIQYFGLMNLRFPLQEFITEKTTISMHSRIPMLLEKLEYKDDKRQISGVEYIKRRFMDQYSLKEH